MTGLRRPAVTAALATLLGMGLAGQLASQEAEPAPVPAAEEPPVSSAYEPVEEPPLPPFPARPELPTGGYPECREEYQTGANYLERADLINACTVALDTYYIKVLLPHRQAMIDYQNEISRLYTEEVAPNNAYQNASRNSFYNAMIEEHGKSNPDGANMAQARALETRYAADRSYLEDRFCYNTGCNGYKDPLKAFPKEVKAMQDAALAEMEAEKEAEKLALAEARRSSSGSGADDKKKAKSSKGKESKGCGRARKRGSALGSFLGGAAGAFGGFGKTGSALLTGFSGLVVGEIACKLDEKEQVEAEKATVTVLAEEKVGAKAEWVSPTRQGVSGSSTITELNAEPNGKKCMTIADVAIIDGEETRVTKQMCRAPGARNYMLVA